MLRFALLCLLGFGMMGLPGCGRDADNELMADQVARINRDVARLTERLDAVDKRLAELAATTAVPAPTGATDTPNIVIPLPGGDSANIDPSVNTLIVVLDQQGTRLDDQLVSDEQFVERIRAQVQRDPETQLVLQAADGVSHGRAVELIDLARENGIERFAIARHVTD